MKKFKRIICGIFVCLFALIGVGCGGNSSNFHQELLEQYKQGLITKEQLQEKLVNSMSCPMYGTKVLYRPDHYDYDGSVGEGNEEYYGQYAWNILSTLLETYGFANNKQYINENHQYYYDSIRYNLFSQDEYNSKIVYKENENGTNSYNGKNYSEKSNESNFTTISVNTANAWKWNFGSRNNPEGYIYENTDYGFDLIENGNIIKNSFDKIADSNEYFNRLPTHYSDNQNIYIKSYLGTVPATEADGKEGQQQIENYSPYVKALEYAIYCFTMSLKPDTITVTLDTDGTPVVSIGGKTVDEALSDIKEVFDKVGTYVGISPSKYDDITQFILDVVIGEKAIKNDSVSITTYDNVVIYEDADGTQHTEISGAEPTTSTLPINRNYESVVAKIVEDVCKYVQIGSSTGDTINNRFPASEIVDYFGNDFFISADKGKEFANIKPLEYQSLVFMFSKETTSVENIQLHFKYDAGMDGDQIIDPNASITIKVYLNYYQHKNNKYSSRLMEMSITVPDGAFNYGDLGHTMMMYGINDENGHRIDVGAFKADSGVGKDLQAMEYDGLTDISNPLKLLGTTSVKDYYQLIEGEGGDLGEGKYYSYGVLNPEKFAGDDGCDYLELAFEVVKTTGKFDDNYKFYVGLGKVC